MNYRVLRGKARDFKRRLALWNKKRLNPPPEPYNRLFRMSISDWLINHQKNIVLDKCSYMGICTQKNPMDAWIYQEMLWEIKPDILLEIGSRFGGSTLYFAHLMDAIGCGKVVSVDIDRSDFAAKHDRIELVTGDSSAPDTVAKVKALCEGKKVMAIHDGDHSRDKVLADLMLYRDLVSVGSYFVVEDGIMDLFTPGDGLGWDRPGPMKAVELFLRENPDFEADPSRERYIITYSPRGYLKRIK